MPKAREIVDVMRNSDNTRGQSGAAALEAILSIVLLFCAFYCMWGVALIIYNQSKLNTATQFASESALIVFDRSTYRGIDPKGIYDRARYRAERVAWSVYRENTCGMLPNQFTGESPEICETSPASRPPGFNLDVSCSSTLTSGYNEENCRSGGIDNAQALRVSAQSEVVSPFDLLSPFSGFGAQREHNPMTLRSEAEAFSFAAEGKVR